MGGGDDPRERASTVIDESELRRRFAQLRDADRARAPGFAEVHQRVRARESWRANLRVRPLAIGAAAAVAIAAVWLAHAPSFSRPRSGPGRPGRLGAQLLSSGVGDAAPE